MLRQTKDSVFRSPYKEHMNTYKNRTTFMKLKMAASLPVGNECEFTQEVPENYLVYCKKCKHVAREATITACCGATFCEECLLLVTKAKLPCPSCKSNDVVSLGAQKNNQDKIKASEVYCTLKKHGCDWSGAFCGLEDHLELCKHKLVTCEIPGCEDKYKYYGKDKHMEESMQAHVSMLGNALKEQKKMFEEKQEFLESKIQAKDSEIRQLQTEMKKQGEEVEAAKRDIKMISEQFKLNTKLKIPTSQKLLPYDISFSAVGHTKATSGYMYSLPMYTHQGGYKFELTLYPNGRRDGRGSHVSVTLNSLKSDNYSELTFPACFKVTLELVNQHKDFNHCAKVIECEVTKEKLGSRCAFDDIGGDTRFIAQADLTLNQETQTQYLKNDCLKFRITNIAID